MVGSESSQPSAPHVRFVDHPEFFECILSPVSNVAGVKQQLEDVLKVVAEKRPTRLLVDMRALSFEPSTMDRYAMGIAGSRFSAHVERVGVVAKKEFIDPSKFGTQVAQNRGLRIDIFADSDEALRWLLEK